MRVRTKKILSLCAGPAGSEISGEPEARRRAQGRPGHAMAKLISKTQPGPRSTRSIACQKIVFWTRCVLQNDGVISRERPSPLHGLQRWSPGQSVRVWPGSLAKERSPSALDERSTLVHCRASLQVVIDSRRASLGQTGQWGQLELTRTHFKRPVQFDFGMFKIVTTRPQKPIQQKKKFSIRRRTRAIQITSARARRPHTLHPSPSPGSLHYHTVTVTT